MADFTVADTFTTDRNKHDFTVYKRFFTVKHYLLYGQKCRQA